MDDLVMTCSEFVNDLKMLIWSETHPEREGDRGRGREGEREGEGERERDRERGREGCYVLVQLFIIE